MAEGRRDYLSLPKRAYAGQQALLHEVEEVVVDFVHPLQSLRRLVLFFTRLSAPTFRIASRIASLLPSSPYGGWEVTK